MADPIGFLESLGPAPVNHASTLSGMALSIRTQKIAEGMFSGDAAMTFPMVNGETVTETEAQRQKRVFDEKKFCWAVARGIIDELIVQGVTGGDTGIVPLLESVDSRITLWDGVDGHHLKMADLTIPDLALVGHSHSGAYTPFTIAPAATAMIETRALAGFYAGKYIFHLSHGALCRSFEVMILNQNSTSLPYTVSNILGDAVLHTLTVEIVGSNMTMTIKNDGASTLTCRVKKRRALRLIE